MINFGKLSKYRNAESYLRSVSQLGDRSEPWDILLLSPRQIVKPEREFIRDFKRVYSASRLSSREIKAEGTLPEIEIFVACIKKDIELLPIVLRHAFLNSSNKITKITVATTSDLLAIELDIEGIKVDFIDENSLISDRSRSVLKSRFVSRYGWVLQQVLALSFVMNSRSEGILVLNADTIITRKQVWLNSKSEQPLMCSYEYNPPYYKFLKDYGFPTQKFMCSHITHHMLMQPEKLRQIYGHYVSKNLDDFVSDIAKNSTSHISPVCVEFELYAYGMLGLFPDLAKKRKFANTSVQRSKFTLDSLVANHFIDKYNSISLHDYID